MFGLLCFCYFICIISFTYPYNVVINMEFYILNYEFIIWSLRSLVYQVWNSIFRRMSFLYDLRGHWFIQGRRAVFKHQCFENFCGMGRRYGEASISCWPIFHWIFLKINKFVNFRGMGRTSSYWKWNFGETINTRDYISFDECVHFVIEYIYIGSYSNTNHRNKY